MEMNSKKTHHYWISVVFFFVGFAPGVWMPSLPTLLHSLGEEGWIPWIYIGMPIGGIIAPFILGALSDGKVAANRLCGYVMMLGGITMMTAFSSLACGARVEVFVVLMAFNSIVSAPLWTLITQVALSHLHGQEEKFTLYRIYGTVGWAVAGGIGGYLLNADESSWAGVVAGVVRIPVGLVCFLMPMCKPLATGQKFSILKMMGQGSRELWATPNTRVLLISAGLIAIPLTSFFMYTPLQLRALQASEPMVWMTTAQWFEIPAMLTLGWACLKFKIRSLLAFGLGVSFIRQVIFSFAAEANLFWLMPIGLLTHGLTFTYFHTVAQIYMEKCVRRELRGRAQGMLSLMFGGIGSLLGVIITGQLFHILVDLEMNTGWPEFWGAISLIASVPVVYFICCYKAVEARD